LAPVSQITFIFITHSSVAGNTVKPIFGERNIKLKTSKINGITTKLIFNNTESKTFFKVDL